MIQLVFHHDQLKLPLASDTVLPVLLYGLSRAEHSDQSEIGHPVVDRIKRMGVRVSPQVMDFLSIALAVTAADTFVRRDETADGWARKFVIKLPLVE
ncbi:MAG: DNA-binding protein, partial [Desulfobulbaceae bacterium]|nr:DNA-binding protein [Desulfobulbaceae bacterium]